MGHQPQSGKRLSLAFQNGYTSRTHHSGLVDRYENIHSFIHSFIRIGRSVVHSFILSLSLFLWAALSLSLSLSLSLARSLAHSLSPLSLLCSRVLFLNFTQASPCFSEVIVLLETHFHARTQWVRRSGWRPRSPSPSQDPQLPLN